MNHWLGSKDNITLPTPVYLGLWCHKICVALHMVRWHNIIPISIVCDQSVFITMLSELDHWAYVHDEVTWQFQYVLLIDMGQSKVCLCLWQVKHANICHSQACWIHWVAHSNQEYHTYNTMGWQGIWAVTNGEIHLNPIWAIILIWYRFSHFNLHNSIKGIYIWSNTSFPNILALIIKYSPVIWKQTQIFYWGRQWVYLRYSLGVHVV